VHLFWTDPRHGQAPIPDDMARNVAAWETLFPDFDVRVWLRDELRDLLEDFHGLRVWDAVRVCRFGNLQSDLARLALLYEYGGFYSDLRQVPLRPFLHELLEYEAAIVAAHQPTIPNYAERLTNSFLGSPPGHSLWHEALKRAVHNIEARRQLSAVALAGIGPLEVAMALRTLHSMGMDGRWDGLETSRQGTALHGNVDFIVVPSHVAWSTSDAGDGWMRRTAGSYINAETPHWSVREKDESPYLSDEELARTPSSDRRVHDHPPGSPTPLQRPAVELVTGQRARRPVPFVDDEG
jgi:hypothetical protein